MNFYEAQIYEKKNFSNKIYFEKNKEGHPFPNDLQCFVGAARLERATACTPCKNASQLHHAPML